MFTGIIEEIGRVKSIKSSGNSARLEISAQIITEDMKKGASIAVNGVCLTVVEFGKDYFSVDVVKETLEKSNLKNLAQNDRINLERAMMINSRFDGHIVLGHCDGIGKISAIDKTKDNLYIEVTPKEWMMKYIACKGSICLDGISLTVADLDEKSFRVEIVPFTKKNTAIEEKKTGYEINMELDVIAKYIDKINSEKREKIDMDFLKKHGYV